jgi:hypothetical protein
MRGVCHPNNRRLKTRLDAWVRILRFSTGVATLALVLEDFMLDFAITLEPSPKFLLFQDRERNSITESRWTEWPTNDLYKQDKRSEEKHTYPVY